ncbi:hypothetical protein SELMODRAFT_407118 [Selaginella moellendorffii]|uniref:Uncharacterized protein n=1 Tax=Selaginella moellendorffii TaxID=88036 RepID=D8R3Z0_SELML|nr:hypothetical protein SELMODRAFT_407118 [Selaginella moellendorffii]
MAQESSDGKWWVQGLLEGAKYYLLKLRIRLIIITDIFQCLRNTITCNVKRKKRSDGCGHKANSAASGNIPANGRLSMGGGERAGHATPAPKLEDNNTGGLSVRSLLPPPIIAYRCLSSELPADQKPLTPCVTAAGFHENHQLRRQLCQSSEVTSQLLRSLLDFMRHVASFGLGLVRLDICQESERHTDVMDAIINHLGLELRSKRSLFGADLHMTEKVQDVLGTFYVISELPPDCFGAYVISMTTASSNVFTVELLQQECRQWEAGVTPTLGKIQGDYVLLGNSSRRRGKKREKFYQGLSDVDKLMAAEGKMRTSNGDAAGYDLVVVDAMHKEKFASSHARQIAGQRRISSMGFARRKEEYNNSFCLCGSQYCHGSYLNLGVEIHKMLSRSGIIRYVEFMNLDTASKKRRKDANFSYGVDTEN